MELNDCPHIFLTKDRRLRSTGQHYPGFPRVLYDSLLCLGYDRDAPIYRCRLSKAHDMDTCEDSMMIPFNPTDDLMLGSASQAHVRIAWRYPSRVLTSMLGWLHWLGMHSTCSTSSTTLLGPACSSICVWQHTRSTPMLPHVSLRGWGIRMSSFAAVHFHLKRKTVSYRLLAIVLVRPSVVELHLYAARHHPWGGGYPYPCQPRAPAFGASGAGTIWAYRPRGDRCHVWHRWGLGLINVGMRRVKFWVDLG
jgi:hypothetical protein